MRRFSTQNYLLAHCLPTSNLSVMNLFAMQNFSRFLATKSERASEDHNKTITKLNFKPEELYMRSLSILQHNSDDDRRAYPGAQFGASFADLTFQARFGINTALYKEMYRQNNETIFTLQEISDTSREQLKDFFASLGLAVLTTKYALDKGSFNYVFAYNPAVFDVAETSQVYYTQNGLSTTDEERSTLSKAEKIERHFGTEFEKSAQLVRLRHKESGEIFLVVNTHPGLELRHRLLAMQKLCDALSQETGMVILTGDFNQFDSRVPVPAIYHDQIKILQEHGFHWASEGLSRVGMKSTFVCKPFDIFHLVPAEDLAAFKAALQAITDPHEQRQFVVTFIQEKSLDVIGTCLDAVFTRGLPQSAKVEVNPLSMFYRKVVNTSQIENQREFQDRYLQHFIENRADAGVEPPLGSDHIALATAIKF